MSRNPFVNERVSENSKRVLILLHVILQETEKSISQEDKHIILNCMETLRNFVPELQ